MRSEGTLAWVWGEGLSLQVMLNPGQDTVCPKLDVCI